ncbi:glutathione S-transferase family protein [Mesorhizobium sp. BR1-1-16]|uniref:glutathione S-transferase family protein n=1 Tax=Mesorhizobium sp. BR1-1-16 TaxID=2876653 RepID=UPI001CCCDAF5|nr:glutathione S-transferase family protein [Mesorhizobium sp. BR1-1-16]MBZ9936437.1 glutathione S-transferase family protein [Mesorhizobium sp. BR1-1-16]
MADFTLHVGTRIWSSWSLRPFMALAATGADFKTILTPLRSATSKAAITAFSPSGLVPVLVDQRPAEPVTIWDSLAICEYLAESFPDLWPRDAAARAIARAVSAEMHSGFRAMRMAMPMDLFAARPGEGLDAEGVATDIQRIDAIFADCRSRFGAAGPYLFGRFSIADAMFAPVASRFRTYGPTLSDPASAYVATLLADPGFKAWEEAALKEM